MTHLQYSEKGEQPGQQLKEEAEESEEYVAHVVEERMPMGAETIEIDNKASGITIRLCSKKYDCKQLLEMGLHVYNILLQSKNGKGVPPYAG